MAFTKKSKLKQPKNRSNKIHLVFDEVKRREFLTGFHKRKLQRKKTAQENLEKQLKDERKRLKAEAKESYKKLVVSSRPIPELAHLLEDQYEDEDVTVKIVELSAQDIAAQNNWIGPNVPKYEDEPVEEDPPDEWKVDEVPGMELNSKTKKTQSVNEKVQFDSQKEVKKILKKQATKNVQKSKVFQTKHKLERQKQRKKSMQQKTLRIKLHKKMSKKRRGRGKLD